MSRAKANWRRVSLMRNKMHRAVVAVRFVQSWKVPPVSLAAMAAFITLSFHPHVILSLCLLSLGCYGWWKQPADAGVPMHMESDPEAEEDTEGNVRRSCGLCMGSL